MQQPKGEPKQHSAKALSEPMPLKGGRDNARPWELVTFGWVADLVAKANREPLLEQDAAYLMPEHDTVQNTVADFDDFYSRFQAKQAAKPAFSSGLPPVFNSTFKTLVRLHWHRMLLMAFWVAAEVGVRLLGPVILRQFLLWLQSYTAGRDPPQWQGWMLAIALGADGFCMALVHHQMFWYGLQSGLLMRQQCIAAIHAKVLRLNSAAIAHVSSGHVVNLVSNDVRRFDDALPFWVFLWAGPLELAMVFVMVVVELGVLPAVAGIAATLLLIPIQALLVRPVGNIRRNTAAKTDERVRLASEAIQGSLAMKMLSWERPIAKALCSIRGIEASWILKMARIRAVNNALYFAITPVVAFATFGVYRACNGALNIPSVFYALSLLALPKLFMVQFFVTGVQSFTELVVSLKRIDRFLSMEEPPAAQQQPTQDTAEYLDGRTPNSNANPNFHHKGTSSNKEQSLNGHTLQAGYSKGTGDHQQGSDLPAHGNLTQPQLASDGAAIPRVRVALRGADYDWARPMGHAAVADSGHAGALSSAPPPVTVRISSQSAARAKAGMATVGSNDLSSVGRPTLSGLRFELAPGELLGVTGEVGSGKSSMLSALLGELLPLPPQAVDINSTYRQGTAGTGSLADGAALGSLYASGSAVSRGAASTRALLAPVAATAAAGTSSRDASAGAFVATTSSLRTLGMPGPLSAGSTVGSTVGLLASGLKAEAEAGLAVAGPSGPSRGEPVLHSTADYGASDQGPILCGRVAYCGQIPWIASGTVRDNIVFNNPWDEAWYRQVLSACALEQDLRDLPGGDMTELGERGINLSGGQKARVALARCCYSRADVQLLDDPLSAVDPRVGRLLFDEAVIKLMQGSTRVLVTHQRQVLPRCDRVLVLRGGRAVALGTWEELQEQGLQELTAGVTAGDGMAEASVDELSAGATADAMAGSKDPQAAPSAEDQGTGSETATAPVPAAAEAKESAAGDGPSGAAAGLDGLEVRQAGGRAVPHVTIVTAAEGAAGAGEASEDPLSQGRRDAAATDSSGKQGLDASGTAALPAAIKRQGTVARARLPNSHTFAWFRSSSKPVEGEPGQGPKQGPGQPLGLPGGAGAAPGKLLEDGEEGEEGEGVQDEEEGVTASRAVSKGRLFRGRSFGTGLARLASLREAVWTGRRAKKLQALEEEEEEDDTDGPDGPGSGKLVKVEGRITGTVEWRVYLEYSKAIGVIASIVIWLLMFGGQAAYLASDWWLALWSRADPVNQLEDYWLWVYGMLTAIVVTVSFVRAFIFFDTTVQAATKVHNQIALRLLKAPLSFFHTNPTGRILNRFSKDLSQVDELLPVTLYDSLQTGFLVMSAFLLVSIAVPVVLPVFVPLAFAFFWLRVRYVCTTREIKRWEAVTRSPVFASFSASIKGLPTIRAFASQPRFHATFLQHLQDNGAWYYAFIAAARWVGFRLDIISATALLASAVLAMVMRASVSPYILGLSLSYTLQLTGYLQWFVRQTAEAENNMTALERLLEYTHLEQEPPDTDQGAPAPPPGWPASGALRYENVTAVYRAGLPPVLRGVSFVLPGGTSCGLVGRTGSGKSSLMLTLFRLIEVTSGTIYLDGLDVASIGLDALRAQLAIIPQDPVLFSGTIRSNLDPWGKHNDAALWEVLSAVKLHKAIVAAGGLHKRMQEAGDNLSVGQRQLFCLARALLQDARVLALDEATANVDRATDALIQQALRDFAHADTSSGRVLLVIAHRLDTIIDMDHLLVLSAGELVEQGSPQELCERPTGLFAGMVAAARVSAAPPASAPPPQR